MTKTTIFKDGKVTGFAVYFGLKRYFIPVFCALAVLCAAPAFAADPFPVAARLADAQQRQAQAQSLAAELERELSLARFSAQAITKEVEALGELSRRDAEVKAAADALAEPVKKGDTK